MYVLNKILSTERKTDLGFQLVDDVRDVLKRSHIEALFRKMGAKCTEKVARTFGRWAVRKSFQKEFLTDYCRIYHLTFICILMHTWQKKKANLQKKFLVRDRTRVARFKLVPLLLLFPCLPERHPVDRLLLRGATRMRRFMRKGVLEACLYRSLGHAICPPKRRRKQHRLPWAILLAA